MGASQYRAKLGRCVKNGRVEFMLRSALWHFWLSTEPPEAILTVLPNFSFRKCGELGAAVEIGYGAAGKSQPQPHVL